MHKLSGSSGTGGTDSEYLQGWLLKFREDSKKLRTSVKFFFDWIANRSPTWAAYCSFMSSGLITIDKQPGVRPVQWGETWIRIFTKCVLRVAGPEAPNTCQNYHLCAGLKAWIDSAVHRAQDIWYTKSTTEDWGFLLTDEKNSFNDINWIGMLWTVHHLWLYGACFVFNCYCHWSYFILRNGNGMASFLHSREGNMQGTH